MMNSIAGIATAGASSAAAEAAGGNMNFGSVRANAVNMNKYDATHAVSAGYSSKLSMDTQQTASNQSSARTGTENLDKNSDVIHHEGSTWITDSQTGKTYEVNGQFKSISGGWEGSGQIIEYSANGTKLGEYHGKITGSGNMDDYQRDVIRGGHGGKENAFKAASVVSSNLDASNITTRNTVDEQNNRYTRISEVDTSNIRKDNLINEEKVSVDKSYTENNSKSIQNNDIYEEKVVKDKSYSENNSHTINNKQTIDNSKESIDGNIITHHGNGTNWNNALQTLMEKGGVDKENTKWMKEFIDMKDKVDAGQMSKEEYGSHLLKFATQLSSDLKSVISEEGMNSLSSSLSGYAKAGLEIRGNGAGLKYENALSGQTMSRQDNIALGLAGLLNQNIEKFQGYVQNGIAENNLRAATGIVNDTQKELTRLMNTDLTTSTAEAIKKGVEKITK